MSINRRYVLFSMTTLLVFVLSLARPILARADDSAPTEEPTAIVTRVPDPIDETPPSATEETATVGEVLPQGGSEPALIEEISPADKPVSLPEILEQAPEDTDVVVLNEDGEAEPLATVEAAETLANGDPFWCPDASEPVPSASGCTGSFATFTELLTFLDANDTDAVFQQNGTIYVTSGTYGGGETSIYIDGNIYGTMQNFSITLQGGWNSTTNTVDSTSSLTAPVTITWSGSVFANDVTVTGTSATGLQITSSNTIAVDNVNIVVTGSSDAAVLMAGGDVNVTNSSFSGSGGNGATINGDGVNVSDSTFDANASGLYILAQDDITLDQVAASDNDYVGLTILDIAGDVSISDSFFNDNLSGAGESSAGLFVIAFDGDVTLANVEANANGSGAFIAAVGNIFISGSNFDDNIAGSGLDATTENPGPSPISGGVADITILNSTFNNNGSSLSLDEYAAGVELAAAGTVTLISVTAYSNHDDGLFVSSNLNTVMSNVTASNNGWAGAYVTTNCTYVYVSGGQYSNNGPGTHGQGYGIWTNGVANGVQFTSMPILSGNFTDSVFEENICVVPVAPGGSGDDEGTGTLPFHWVNVMDGEPVILDCLNYSGTVLTMPNRDWIVYYCPTGGTARSESMAIAELPGELGNDETYLSALSVGLENGNETTILPVGPITVAFQIPEGLDPADLAVLYWDPELNNGAGDWMELPADALYESLYDPTDGKLVLLGPRVGESGAIETTVNFIGTFVLVSK